MTSYSKNHNPLISFTMNKSLTSFICFLIISNLLHGQATPKNNNSTDSEGQKIGTWTLLFDVNWQVTNDTINTEFYRIISYKNGEPFGKVRDYKKDGSIQMEASLLSENPDVYDGTKVLYSDNGLKVSYAVYKKGVKNYKKSKIGMEKILHLQKQEFDIEKSDYAYFLNELGWCYYQLKNYSSALPCFENAANIYLDLNGENDFSYGSSLNNLALLHESLNDYAKAEPLFEKSAIIIRDTFGDDHIYYAISLYNWAGQLYNLARYDEALDLYNQCVSIREAKAENSQKDREYYKAVKMSANTYQKLNRDEEANKLYKIVEDANIDVGF